MRECGPRDLRARTRALLLFSSPSRELRLASFGSVVVWSFAFVGFWTLANSSAHADLLTNFPPAPGPVGEANGALDITTSFIETSYTYNNATFGTFSANAPFDCADFVSSVINDVPYSINYTSDPLSDFKISLNLNPATGVALSGTFTLLGTAPSYGASSGTLLTGSILDFYSPNATQAAEAIDGQEFQFIFKVTGGDLASHFGTIAIDLHGVDAGSFNGTFGPSANFCDTNYDAYSDTYSAPAVPEPSPVVILVSGAFALISSIAVSCGSIVRLGHP